MMSRASTSVSSRTPPTRFSANSQRRARTLNVHRVTGMGGGSRPPESDTVEPLDIYRLSDSRQGRHRLACVQLADSRW